ncbi:kinesin, putative [Trypanosoma brucei gambiense DAL972]|uniref:Kinesin, putative n=1 Tax=Trypanosoma brucei gambiense (strain MHOM/CI/86/DAL972) TaxID=679716 RepID=C9ZZN5_TRYB9|nr:kinesin, putative [Trypanosoma brucei gambiense DAL972]CBH14884.1 kinesin, putative [Trypanosoma brucei gambiense DAL972]|eukprot:XP_011777150.1 kinesin, putative [Trypanosoma brucei gambiense DAL972]
MADMKKVTVAVRVRPILRDGISQAHVQEKFELEAIRRTGDTTLKVELERPGEPTRGSAFTFDHIFDQESTQLDVYDEAVADLVDMSLTGANSTILAYGQTGSGKTFTVLGDVKPNPLEDDLLTKDSGMFLRVLSDLMEYKRRQLPRGFHVVVGLSCVEIYNENIRDLFGGTPNSPPPSIKAVMIGEEVLLPSLIIKEMTSLQAVFSEIQLAISRRKSRSTEANAVSSRSHCLFLIDILQQSTTAPAPSLTAILQTKKGTKDVEAKRISTLSGISNKNGAPIELKPGELPFDGMVYRLQGQKEPIYGSKILLADLAGSEKISRSGVTGEGLAEATAINSSLTALGNVVHSLHEGGYVSYRTSNLTRLLKPTFSHPNSRVLLLSQVSPTQMTFDETISTLHFANKVKAMKVTTSTGMEADKIQFEYVEAGRTYDGLLADLRLFAVEQQTKVGVIRRRCRQNDGLFYAPLPSGRAGTRERRQAFIESIGASKAATEEREAGKVAREREAAAWEEELRRKRKDGAESAAATHAQLLREAKEGLVAEEKAVKHQAMQEVQHAQAAGAAKLQAEEEASRALLLGRFAQVMSDFCRARLQEAARVEEEISRELNSTRMASSSGGNGSGAASEVPVEDLEYAVSCWGHSIAKKFYTNCAELRELQLQMCMIGRSCLTMERWKAEHVGTA